MEARKKRDTERKESTYDSPGIGEIVSSSGRAVSVRRRVVVGEVGLQLHGHGKEIA